MSFAPKEIPVIGSVVGIGRICWINQVVNSTFFNNVRPLDVICSDGFNRPGCFVVSGSVCVRACVRASGCVCARERESWRVTLRGECNPLRPVGLPSVSVIVKKGKQWVVHVVQFWVCYSTDPSLTNRLGEMRCFNGEYR